MLLEIEVCFEEEEIFEICLFVVLFVKLYWVGCWVVGIGEERFRVEWK